MAEWDREFDFVVIGSGGGLCAALAAKDAGADVVVLEKESLIGGSTAMSGGVLWIPANPLMAEDGDQDSVARAQEYLDCLLGDPQPGSTPERRRAFLEAGPKLIGHLRANKGIRFLRDDRPDYYDELPGGSEASRSLVVRLFDSAALGAWRKRLQAGPVPLPVEGPEARLMTLAGRTPKGLAVALRVYGRKYLSRILGRELYGIGAALQGRMLQAVLAEGIALEVGCGALEFVQGRDGVAGVVVDCRGTARRLRARNGILIASGGFARNLELRRRWQPDPASVDWTNANPGDTGEMIEAARELGAAVHNTHESVWVPSSLIPGREKPAVHATELAKPHLIVVDREGRRIFNEAGSYMEAGQKMYAAGAFPCWAVMDRRHRANYNWGKTPPRLVPRGWTSSGYLKVAPSLAELAAQCGIDGQGLADTVARFNGFAGSGRDSDFNRGARAYDRYWGDSRVRPNPSLGSVEKPPFYAVRIYPGDVGTFGGLVTDEHARVLREDGAPIPGLYATGNATASVFGNRYPGAGASIAASFVFGHVAARHALRSGRDRKPVGLGGAAL